MTEPRREVLADGVEVWCGDCTELLTGMEAPDSIIVDPVWPNVPEGLLPGSDHPYDLFRHMWDAACWISGPPKRIVVIMRRDSDPRILEPIYLPFLCASVLEYVTPGYLGRVLGGMEIAYAYGEPIASVPGRRVIPGHSAKAQPGGTNCEHPCARNDAHMEWIVDWFSDGSEHILDPFMGSGTTGVAAVKLGRRFTGIEIDPGYFDIARRRIEAALKEPDMFVPAPKPPKQTSIFDGDAA